MLTYPSAGVDQTPARCARTAGGARRHASAGVTVGGTTDGGRRATGSAFGRAAGLALVAALLALGSEAHAQAGVSVDQEGGFNAATVSQSGGEHRAAISTVSAAARIEQGNAARISQTGTEADEAIIRQGLGTKTGGADATIEQAGGGGNFALIDQNVSYGATRVYSVILQDGVGNSATTYLLSEYSLDDATRIVQLGANNTAVQTKESARGGSLTIEQTSPLGAGTEGNLATQRAHGSVAAVLFIRQVGSGNEAVQDVYQATSATTLQFGDDNLATIRSLSGTLNDLRIEQGTDLGPADGNVAHLLISGSGNSAVVLQYSDGNWVNAELSAGSSLTVTQDGLAGSRLVGITGDAIDPSAAARILGGSVLTLVQSGGGANIAAVDLTAGGVAQITQDGYNNSALVIQR